MPNFLAPIIWLFLGCLLLIILFILYKLYAPALFFTSFSWWWILVPLTPFLLLLILWFTVGARAQ